MKFMRYSSAVLPLLVFFSVGGMLPAAAQIQVISTTPNSATQGTINLDVIVRGNGFKNGAIAQWFVTGTTNPGGVTVNSTAFNSSSQLTANITVASGATISGYDVVVKNATGRTGKGTDLFAVTACTTTGTPSGFTLVTGLNPVQPNGAALITTLRIGNAVRARPLDLNGDGVVDTLVAVVTSGQTGSEVTYAFLLDPATGSPQAKNPITGAQWQNPMLLLSGVWSYTLAAGDVNGDHVPDFLMSTGYLNVAYLFVGKVNNNSLSYTAYQILPPVGAPSYFGEAAALGDLDGDGADEIVIGATSPDSSNKKIPAVFIFKFDPVSNSVKYVSKIQDPTGSAGSQFGSAIAIGNIEGNAGTELVVGAKTAATTNGGSVFVFPAPVQQSSYFAMTGPGPGFGEGISIADVNLDGIPDLVVNTGAQFSGSDTTAQTLVYAGPVHAGASYVNQLLPASGMAYSWGAPNFDVGDMLAGGAVAIGTPNSGSCSTGAVQLFTTPFGRTQSPEYVFEPPTGLGAQFGYGVGVVPGYPFVLVGDHFSNVGNTSQAGQVYVYKHD